MDIYDTSIPSGLIIAIIIRNYPSEYNEVMQIFKEYLKGTWHITKYCHIKPSKENMPIYCSWNLKDIQPENIFIFPYSHNLQQKVLHNVIWESHLLPEYTIINTFSLDFIEFKRTGGYPIEFHSSLGTIQIDNINAKYLEDY